jgi:hypothetical protein
MSQAAKKRKNTYQKPVSLYPMTLDEAVSKLLKAKPKKNTNQNKNKKTKTARE